MQVYKNRAHKHLRKDIIDFYHKHSKQDIIDFAHSHTMFDIEFMFFNQEYFNEFFYGVKTYDLNKMKYPGFILLEKQGLINAPFLNTPSNYVFLKVYRFGLSDSAPFRQEVFFLDSNRFYSRTFINGNFTNWVNF